MIIEISAKKRPGEKWPKMAILANLLYAILAKNQASF